MNTTLQNWRTTQEYDNMLDLFKEQLTYILERMKQQIDY